MRLWEVICRGKGLSRRRVDEFALIFNSMAYGMEKRPWQRKPFRVLVAIGLHKLHKMLAKLTMRL
jgi:hypothetical protein